MRERKMKNLNRKSILYWLLPSFRLLEVLENSKRSLFSPMQMNSVDGPLL